MEDINYLIKKQPGAYVVMQQIDYEGAKPYHRSTDNSLCIYDSYERAETKMAFLYAALRLRLQRALLAAGHDITRTVRIKEMREILIQQF